MHLLFLPFWPSLTFFSDNEVMLLSETVHTLGSCASHCSGTYGAPFFGCLNFIFQIYVNIILNSELYVLLPASGYGRKILALLLHAQVNETCLSLSWRCLVLIHWWFC